MANNIFSQPTEINATLTVGGNNNLITTGQIGIGTTSPTDKLEISDGRIRISNTVSGRSATIGLDDNYNFYIKNPGAGNLYLGTGTTTLVSGNFAVDGGTLYVKASNNNVGIGTTSPEEPLHIVSAGVDDFIRIENTSTYTGLWMNDGGANNGWLVMSGYTNTPSQGDFAIREYGVQTALVIKQTSGNVGIGTTSPSQKLEVSGYARATSGFVGSTNLKLFGDNTSTEFLAVNTNGTVQMTAYGAGYLKTDASGNVSVDTSIIEDTLDSVTDRGATTTNAITVGGITVGDSHFIGNQTGYDNLIIISSTAENIVLGGANGIFFNTNAVSASNAGDNRMYLSNAGNLGIGTTSPESALQVVGTVPGSPTTDGVHIGQTSDGSYGVIQLVGTTGGYIDFSAAGNDRDGRILYQNSSNTMQFQTGSNTKMIIAGDNVGIGTASPSRKLHVVGGDVYAPSTSDTAGTGSFGGNSFEIRNSATGEHFNIDVYNRTSSAWYTPFHIQNTGNVGIGTTSPSYKLQINGSGSDSFAIDVASTAGTADQNAIRYLVDGVLKAQIGVAIDSGRIITDASANDYIIKSWGNIRFGNEAGSHHATITNSGNVGIGTTSPSDKFHVVGNARFGGGASDQHIKILYGNGGSDYGAIRFYQNGSNQSTIHSFSTGWQSNNPLVSGGSVNITGITATTIGDWNDPDAVIRNGGSTYFKNNVGIGTTSPLGKLDIRKAQSSTPFTSPFLKLFPTSTTNETGHTSITLGTSPVDNYGVSLSGWRFGTNGNPKFRIKMHAGVADGIDALSIDHTGNVGIGTTSPAQKLEVVGTIKAGVAGDASANIPALLVTSSGTGDAQAAIAIQQATGEGDTIIFADYEPFVEWGISTENAANKIQFTAGTSTGNLGSKTLYNNAGDARTAYIKFDHDLASGQTLIGGNVGIGTTSPGAKLDVIAGAGTGVRVNSTVQDGTTRDGIFLYEDDAQADGRQAVSWYNGNQNYYKARIWTEVGDNYNNTRFGIDTADNSRTVDTRLTIYNGNVGIGTTSPSTKLQVADGGVISFYRSGNDRKGQLYTNSLGTVLESDSIGNDPLFLRSPGTSGMLLFFTSTSEKMRITSSGNVGIGTTSPFEKLHVDGRIYVTSNPGSDGIVLAGSGSTNNPYAYIVSTDEGSQDVGIAFYVTTDAGTTNTEALRLDDVGNVGIGTTSPEGKLDVVGSTIGGTAQSDWVNDGISYNDYGDLTISRRHGATKDSDWGFSGPLIDLRSSNAGAEWSVAQIMGTVDSFGGSNHAGGLMFLTSGGGTTDPTGRRTDGSAPQVRMGIGPDGTTYMQGNVGIGTTSPGDKLHVLSSTNTVARFETSLTSDMAIELKNSQGSMFFGLGGGEEFAIGTDADLNGTNSKFVVKPSGNVGIGTSSPDAHLEISANAGADPSPITNPVTLRLTDAGNAATGQGDTTNPWAKIEFYSEDGSSGGPAVQAQIATIYDDIYSAGSHISFSNTATPTNGLSEKMRITSTGNVGIGTTSPAAHLDVKGSGNGSVNDHIRITSTDTEAKLAFVNTSGNSAISSAGDDLRFFTNTANVERMRIAGSGNVGIGTTSPAAKLDVEGRIVDDSDSYVLSHRRLRTINSSNYFRLSDYSTVDDFHDQWGPKTSSGGTITKVDDPTAPAEGCFEITNDFYVDAGGDFIKVDQNEDYTFEMYIKYISGTDTSSRLYLGWSMYDENKNYFGNTQRYWGVSAAEFDANSRNNDWYKVIGTIGGIGTSTGQFIDGTEYVKPLALFNYGGGGVTTRVCGFKLYRSSNQATKLRVLPQDYSGVSLDFSDEVLQTIEHSEGSGFAGIQLSNSQKNNSWGNLFIGANNDWGGSYHPTLGSNGGSSGSLVMIQNPHIPFRTDNKVSGYDGRAGLRMARDASGNWWDAGLAGDFFHIYRNGTGEFLRVTNSGNVGIGTTSPGAKLTVSGAATGLYTNLLLSNTNDTDGDATGIGFSMLDNMTYVKGGIFYERTDTGGRGSIHIATTNTTDSTSVGLSDARLTVDKGGNVGIGTTSPLSNTNNYGLHLDRGDHSTIILGDPVNNSHGGFIQTSDNKHRVIIGANVYDDRTGSWSVAESGKGIAGISMIADTGTWGTSLNFWAGDTDSIQNRMVILANGNVGIGTTNPGAKLDVRGGATFIGDYTGTVTPTDGIWLERPSGNSTQIQMYTTGASIFRIASDGTTANIGWGSGADREVNFQNTGAGTIKVGIGTGAPATPLDVIGTIRSTYDSTHYAQFESNASGGVIKGVGGNGFFVRSYGDSYFNGGNVGIGTTSPARKLHVVDSVWDNSAGGGVIFENSNSVGASLTLKPSASVVANGTNGWALYAGGPGAAIGDGNLGFWAHGTNDARMMITRGGNVGIGTTSPGAKLQVKGNALIGTSDTTRSTAGLTVGYVDTSTFGANADVGDANRTVSIVNDQNDTTNTYATLGFRISPATSTSMGDFKFVRTAANENSLIWTARHGTSWYDRFSIKSDGNVGIGTTSPAYKLDIAGGGAADTVKVNVSGNDAIIKLGGADTNGPHGLQFGHDSAVGSDGMSMYYRTGPQHIVFEDSTSTSGTSLMVISRFGNVGIGTTSPDSKLHVSSSATNSIEVDGAGNQKMFSYSDSGGVGWCTGKGSGSWTNLVYLNTNDDAVNIYTNDSFHTTFTAQGYVGVGTVNPSYKLDVSGTIRATGDIIAYSDARVKENVETIPNALDKVKAMRGVGYNKIGDKKRSVGVIAQEMLEVMPEAVHQDESGMYSVAYGNLVGVLIEAMKEQQQQIDELKSRLDGSAD